MTTNDMFKKIYQELKENWNNAKTNNEKFVVTYTIPSINYSPKDESLEDHYFTSGIEMELYRLLQNFNGDIDYYSYQDTYYFSNDKELIREHLQQQMDLDDKLKIQFIDKKPPIEERNPNLFYYDIRNSDVDNGYTIERDVLVNNIGSLIANKDILKDKEYITDEELQELEFEEVTDFYSIAEMMEDDMEM